MKGLASQRKKNRLEKKPNRNSLGRNPLSDAPYRNPGVVINEQGPGRHPLGAAPYLDPVKNELRSGRHSLSGTLHQRPPGCSGK